MIFINARGVPSPVKSRTDGFSLLEVIIAMAILAVGILGLSKMQIAAIKGNHSAMELTTAGTLATDEIEALMVVDYDGLSTDGGTKDEGKFTIKWTITPSDPVPNVKKITMVVTWNDRGKDKVFVADYYKAITF